MTSEDSARRLGLPSATALIIANMIGAGIFTTTGFLLLDLSPGLVLVAFTLGGMLALCGALSYAGLVHALPESGGEYYFLSRTLHPLAGVLAGWVSLLAGFTGPIALAALVLGAYAQNYLPASFPGDEELRQRLLASGAVLLAWLLHGIRLHYGVVLQNVAVVLKVLMLAGLVVAGFLFGSGQLGEAAPSADNSLGKFAVGMVYISLTYSGWNASVYVAGEIRQPRRYLPLSLIGGTMMVMALYVTLNVVFLQAAPAETLAGKKEVAAVAAAALGGDWLQALVTAVVVLALWTSISSMILAGPRVYARMARDGFLPAWFGRFRDVPSAAVATQALLALVVLWISDLGVLLGYLGFTLGLSTAATVIGMMLHRRRVGAAEVPCWGFPFVPLAYVGVTLVISALMVQRQPMEALLGLGTVALGLPFYWLRRRRGTDASA